MAALDALARPGTTACTVCDDAEVLLPILAHGQNDKSTREADRMLSQLHIPDENSLRRESA